MTFRVSTSEVATFLTCKQRWMYAHHPSYRLEPRTLGVALTRGLIGHEALEVYYGGISAGKSESDSRSLAQNVIIRESLKAINLGDGEKAKMVSLLGARLKHYYEDDATKRILSEYNILGVEMLVEAKLPHSVDVIFAGRIDLALQKKSGINKGEVYPWDHKFTYNKWPQAAIDMNAQISNYVWALRELGYRSRSGVLNMVRYREDAIDKFFQAPVETNSTMRSNFIRNHLAAAEEIVHLKLQKTVGLEDGVTRSTSKFNCEYCPFVDLCLIENRGQDSTNMIKARFRPNSYGYDSELDVS